MSATTELIIILAGCFALLGMGAYSAGNLVGRAEIRREFKRAGYTLPTERTMRHGQHR
jgi:hypothetical protein